MIRKPMDKFDYYFGVLIGAYLVIATTALGVPVSWWSPIIWVGVWVFIEGSVWFFTRKRRTT